MLSFIPHPFTPKVKPVGYLNTSHVIFYQIKTFDGIPYLEEFKYISCYLLSFPRSVSESCSHYLNTSHVIFYQKAPKYAEIRIEFKYISCYLLSKASACPNCGCPTFKYISCYLLSAIRKAATSTLQNLNTSHVIFYPGGPQI